MTNAGTRTATTLFDTHAHLHDRGFDSDREAVLTRAWEAGVGAIVTVGTDLAESAAAVELASRQEDVWATVGIHPHHADEWGSEARSTFVRLAADPSTVAIGEIGLDFFRNLSPPDVQRRALREQLALAVELDLPVVIHSRDADAEVEPILMEWAAALPRRPDQPVGVLHCFSGDAELAVRYARAGFMISFAGVVTYPKNDALREAARAVGAESIVVETDCPYLTPQFKRGKRNEPAYVAETARFIAELRGESVAKFAKTTVENGRRLFRLPATAKMTR
jgi:TatD DNase family protein